MISERKEKLISFAVGAFVWLAAAAVPFGFFMALHTDNGWWFLLCLFLVIFLS